MLRAVIWSALLACGLAMTPFDAKAEERPGMFAEAANIADRTSDICAAVIFDGRTYEETLGDWTSVNPRPISDLATHAWRSATFNDTYVMRLPNGGCSFSIDDGDGDMLRARVLERMTARMAFEAVGQEPTREGRATRYAYCTAEPYPYVISMVVGERRSHPHLVFNLFRASTPTPSFCRPTTAAN